MVERCTANYTNSGILPDLQWFNRATPCRGDSVLRNLHALKHRHYLMYGYKTAIAPFAPFAPFQQHLCDRASL